MKVICIDDSNRPSKISEENWIKQGRVYTVTEVKKMGLQQNMMGFKLAEITLPENSFPYEFFNASRFGIPVEHVEDNDPLSTDNSELGIL